MLVIIEGADGSGKTTLFNELKHFYKTVKIERHSIGQFAKYELCSENDVYIMDRSFITDIVYRTFDTENRDYIDLKDAAQLLFTGNMKIVLCETDTQYEDSIRRGEDNITDRQKADNIKQLYNWLCKIFVKFSNTDVLFYNWKESTLDDVLNFIRR